MWQSFFGQPQFFNGGSLKQIATTKGLIYGAASGHSSLSTNGNFAASFAKECGILVPEGSLKWDTLRPTSSTFDFTNGDWLANFTSQNNMLFRGHTLVWYKALPAWFAGTVNAQNAEQYLTDHITTVAGHYAGNMHSWDVVNEAIESLDELPNGMRNSPWLTFLGENYIDIAFNIARAADPNALLVLNQNHLEYDSQGDTDSRTYTLNLLQRLQSRNVPVQALGIQAHLSPASGKFNANVFKTFLSDVASLGLKIMITELDVYDQTFPQLDGDFTRDKMVAEKYQEFLSVALSEPAVIVVITWGLSDKYTWLSSYAPRVDKNAVRPLPLDSNFKRKLVYSVMYKVFQNAPVR